MSYSEQNGQVVLTLSVEDWQMLLIMLGSTLDNGIWRNRDAALEFLNRLNEGNPHYIPYQVETK